MKSSGLSSFALAAGLIVINLAVAIVVFFVAMPLLLPADTSISPVDLAAVQRDAATLFFVAGVVLSLVIVFGARIAARRSASLQDTLDAIRQPCFILDEHNAYAVINAEAERVLAISRERDVGKSVGMAIQTALAAASSAGSAGGVKNGLNRGAIVTFGGIRYMALDNPFATRGGAGRTGRLVVLRNVDVELRIRDCFKDIVSSMAVLNDDTRNIVESTSRLTRSAADQDNSIATITSSLDEFSKKIQGNTESAAKGTQFAAQAREVAERSGGEIAHALSAMNEVQDVGIRIARIVKLIDDIAFQTNLLALNASVEAARAGRQGKGFAVVAEEVRNLAGRSARAAKDTASMVEDVTERIGNASSYMSRLEEMLRNIVQEAVRMADYSASAAATSTEQATAILQVNQDLGQVNSITRSTCAAADEASGFVGSLEKKVGELRERLERFAMDMDTSRTVQQYAARQAAKGGALPTPSNAVRGDENPGRYATFGSAPVDDDEFVEPFKKMAAEKWDLRAEADRDESPLPDLLRTDGYEKAYNAFLRSTEEVGESLSQISGRVRQSANTNLASGSVDYKTNREGDKIVRPEQKIHLDDAEFGRY